MKELNDEAAVEAIAHKREYAKQYRANHLGQQREYGRRWRAAHLEKARASVRASKEKRQYEILLKNGMKQYAMGTSPAHAVNVIAQWVSRSQIVSVKEYQP